MTTNFDEHQEVNGSSLQMRRFSTRSENQAAIRSDSRCSLRHQENLSSISLIKLNKYIHVLQSLFNRYIRFLHKHSYLLSLITMMVVFWSFLKLILIE